MAEAYQYFVKDQWRYDFSQSAKEALYIKESLGTSHAEIADNNGFARGKFLLDITVTMWVEDLESGLLHSYELYLDFPKWFVDKILPTKFHLSDSAIQAYQRHAGHLHCKANFADRFSGEKEFYFNFLMQEYNNA